MSAAFVQLNAAVVRKIVAIICVGCVAGMIASAATHHLGPVITLGCISTAAVITLIAVVATESASVTPSSASLARAQRVEDLVTELVGSTASEQSLRSLVGEAVNLGRALNETERPEH